MHFYFCPNNRQTPKHQKYSNLFLLIQWGDLYLIYKCWLFNNTIYTVCIAHNTNTVNMETHMDKFIKQHSSGLIILNIPEELNQNTYDFFEKKWMESDSACLNISKFNNLNLLRELFELVLNQPDSSFKNALLNYSEYYKKLLAQIYRDEKTLNLYRFIPQKKPTPEQLKNIKNVMTINNKESICFFMLLGFISITWNVLS